MSLTRRATFLDGFFTPGACHLYSRLAARRYTRRSDIIQIRCFMWLKKAGKTEKESVNSGAVDVLAYYSSIWRNNEFWHLSHLIVHDDRYVLYSHLCARIAQIIPGMKRESAARLTGLPAGSFVSLATRIFADALFRVDNENVGNPPARYYLLLITRLVNY